MIIIEKSIDTNGIIVNGDFFDFDRLYFAIFKFTGFHGLDQECTFPGYDAVCENLLGLCYEMRHAWQGDRDLVQVYNGVKQNWFDDYKESVKENKLKTEFDEDYEEDGEQEASFKFLRAVYPDVSENNTYFSFLIPFPEAVFYALILLELLENKDLFLLKRRQLAETEDNMQEMNKEYFLFQAEEDIARITLFTKNTLRVLYKFIGNERYERLLNKFKSMKNFFLHCDLHRLNEIMVNYGEKEYENDAPEILFSVLMSFFE